MVIFFVCLLPVRHLLSSMAVLYHVSDKVQKAYSCGWTNISVAFCWIGFLGSNWSRTLWNCCRTLSRLSVAGTVGVRWITSICFESIGFGLRGLTQLGACVLPTVVLHLKFVSGKPQKKALTSQTGSGKTLLPTHLQRLVFCLISDLFADHIVVKPPHGERPFLSILPRCWNSVPRWEWRFLIRRWRQHGIYLLAVWPYFLQNNV